MLTPSPPLLSQLPAAAQLFAGSVAAKSVLGFGKVSCPTSCRPAVQSRFETAVARLHAFDGPNHALLAVAAADPHCAIEWWGAAMTVRGNPLAGAPSPEAFRTGQADIARAVAARLENEA